MFEAFIVALASVWADSGFSALTSGNVIMIGVGLVPADALGSSDLNKVYV